MPEINLLQGEKRSSYQAPSVELSGKGVLWFMIAVVVLEALAYGGLFFWRKLITDDTSGMQSKIFELDSQLKARRAETEQAVSTQSALVTFGTLLDKHLYWTELWKELGKTAFQKVRYLNLQAAAETNKFTLRGQVGNYTEVGKVMLGLQTSPNFSRIDFVSSTPAEGDLIGIKFEFLIFMKPQLLQPPASSAVLKPSVPK